MLERTCSDIHFHGRGALLGVDHDQNLGAVEFDLDEAGCLLLLTQPCSSPTRETIRP